MGRVGRPRSIDAPPCPACGRSDRVVSLGLQDVAGEPRRAFRCAGCGRGFVPGVEGKEPSAALKAAVRRARKETEAPYRLIASALARHLGVRVSHTTVGAWCRGGERTESGGESALACEYLSVLWALRHEIEEEHAAARRS